MGQTLTQKIEGKVDWEPNPTSKKRMRNILHKYCELFWNKSLTLRYRRRYNETLVLKNGCKIITMKSETNPYQLIGIVPIGGKILHIYDNVDHITIKGRVTIRSNGLYIMSQATLIKPVKYKRVTKALLFTIDDKRVEEYIKKNEVKSHVHRW